MLADLQDKHWFVCSSADTFLTPVPCAQIKEVIPGMHPNLDSNTATRATGSGVGDNPAPHLAGNPGTYSSQTTPGGIGGEGYAQGAGGMSTEVSLFCSACQQLGKSAGTGHFIFASLPTQCC